MTNSKYKRRSVANVSLSSRWPNRIVVIAVLLVTLSWFSLAHARKILFIGNSFTGYAKPMLEQLVQLNPSSDDHLGFAFRGGISLSEHARRPETLHLLDSEPWDYVIIQDHSQQPIRDSQGFELSVTEWVARIRSRGAESVLFMTWARREGNKFAAQQTQVSSAYREMGSRLSVAVASVGDVWLKTLQTNPEVFERLHQEDGIHATELGSWVAAVSIYMTLCQAPITWVQGKQLSDAEQRNYQTALHLITAVSNQSEQTECDKITE